jgi:hypothetical protein
VILIILASFFIIAFVFIIELAAMLMLVFSGLCPLIGHVWILHSLSSLPIVPPVFAVVELSEFTRVFNLLRPHVLLRVPARFQIRLRIIFKSSPRVLVADLRVLVRRLLIIVMPLLLHIYSNTNYYFKIYKI